jgi:hypothetical protein
VGSFQIAPNNTVYLLTTAGALWNATTGVDIASGVQSLSMSGGSIFFLANGNLYENSPNTLVDLNVSSYYFTAGGQLVANVFAMPPALRNGVTYTPVSGPLFGPWEPPLCLDVEQGSLCDCWLLASLAEVAARDPEDIDSMFTFLGNTTEGGSAVGVYRVRFFDRSNTARYVNVDTELPTVNGVTIYDHPPADGALWVALAEKAYAEANGAGWVTTGDKNSDSYAALNGGWPSWALQAITGKPATDLNPINIPAAWNADQLIVLTTGAPACPSYIVGGHCYAVVNYTASSADPIEVFNPWGAPNVASIPSIIDGQEVWALAPNSQEWGLFSANAAFVSQNFDGQSIGTGAAAGMDDASNGSQEVVGSLYTNSLVQTAIPQNFQQADGSSIGEAAIKLPSGAQRQSRLAVDSLFAAWGEGRRALAQHSAVTAFSPAMVDTILAEAD